MKLKRIVVGSLEANCYILSDGNKAILIDPGDNYELILDALGNLELIGILVTHSHFDHIGALDYFESKYHLKHNEDIPYFTYQVINTPGHSKDSKSFYFPEYKIMFTGDFIFKGSIGRMDLPGGNILDMKNSLDMIYKYSDDIVIYPGHGDATTLKEEKKNFKYYI
jgi:glyoxylase-like metal-dependent hydrolase (beta-lactamase superfamily II)